MDAMVNFWANVGMNLCSDVLFVILLFAASWVLWHWTALAKARRFFGTGPGGNITIYVSAHHDSATTTRTVVTLEEYVAASDLKRQLERKLGETLFGRAAKRVAGLVGVEPSVPDPVIVALPPESPAPRLQGATIVIGGPVRNVAAKYCIESGTPLIGYDKTRQAFVIRKGERMGDALPNSGDSAIIEKTKVEGQSVILAYGFGEIHTRAAVEFLSSNWIRLHDEHWDENFVVLLRVDSAGHGQPVAEFVHREAVARPGKVMSKVHRKS